MGFLDVLKSAASGLTGSMKKLANNDVMHAIAAGCAVVAAADGSIDVEEKAKMLGFIKRREELKVFKASDVSAAFASAADDIEFDYEIGKLEAAKHLRKMDGKTESAELVAKICCAIGASDGDFDDDEKDSVRWICSEMGISASVVGL